MRIDAKAEKDRVEYLVKLGHELSHLFQVRNITLTEGIQLCFATMLAATEQLGVSKDKVEDLRERILQAFDQISDPRDAKPIETSIKPN